MSSNSIRGATVLITGAARGIGRALALGFLADGAHVVGADILRGDLAKLETQGVSTIVTDVTSDADVKEMVRFAIARTGRIDVVFNNAGLGDVCSIETMPDDLFERVVGSHLFGSFYVLRAALPIMRRQNYGRVINLLSRGAELRRPNWSAYAAAKAAMFALTRIAAAEAADADILVNGMIPGPTSSGMNTGQGLQPPEAVYPSALWMATLPKGGPNGEVFWNCKPYALFHETNLGPTAA